MKKLFFTARILCLLLLLPSVVIAKKLKEIEFNDTAMIDVVRTLSELSESNIIATPEATKKKVTIHLKNTSVESALKSISRITDLWYRFDEDTNTYRLMTRNEYGKDLIVRDSVHIEVFNVRNANVRIIAQAIEDLYGSRVILSLGEEVGGGSSSTSSGTVRNSRSTGGSNRKASRSGASNTNNKPFDTSELTIDQFERLSEQMAGGNSLDAKALEQVSSQSQPIYISVNNEHNMIIVRSDDKTVLKSIDKLINKMDIAVPQVMLEMKILNIILGDDFNSIFNFELEPSGGNSSLKPVQIGNNNLLNTGSFVYEFLNSRLRANIEFLEQNKRVNVLSNPMVLASNHRQAELFIGEESLLVRGFTYNSATIDNGVVVSPSYIETETELEEIGITLRIRPRINSDRTVSLELEQESSSINVGGAILPLASSDGTVLNLPVDTVNSSRLRGTVVARDNLTVAVGGLIRTSKLTNEKKVPVLSEIPFLGRVFRSTVDSEEETETVLLITPRILTNPGESETVRKTDNRFYQDLNRGHPEIPPFENKFIDKEVKQVPVEPAPISKPKSDRQALYMEMSQYAATTVRIPDIERVRNKDYQPVPVSNTNMNELLNNSSLKAKAVASWQRGGMFVTAVEVVNTSSSPQTVEYGKISGRWLASSIENSQLEAKGNLKDRTNLYLISALSFEESFANGL